MVFEGVITFISIVILGIIGMLRMTKGIMPLRANEAQQLPSLPGPSGLIYRLDGPDKKQRKLLEGKYPRITPDGQIILPSTWDSHVTAGRVAYAAYTWALCILNEKDPEAAKNRHLAVARATMIPFFTLLILGIGMLFGLKFGIAFPIFLAVWAFFTFAAIPSQFRDWKAIELAKSGLKESGLWPSSSTDAKAIERCLQALAWCHVAGFRRIFPR